MFDKILEVASKDASGSGKVLGFPWCLSGPLKRLAYSRIDLSLQRTRKAAAHAGVGRGRLLLMQVWAEEG